MKKYRAPIFRATSNSSKLQRIPILRSLNTYPNNDIDLEYFCVSGAKKLSSLGWNSTAGKASKFISIKSTRDGTVITNSRDDYFNFIHNAQINEFKKISKTSGISIAKNEELSLLLIGTVSGNLKCSLNILEFSNDGSRIGIQRAALNKEFSYKPKKQVSKIALNLRIEGRGQLFLKQIEIDTHVLPVTKINTQPVQKKHKTITSSEIDSLIPSLYAAISTLPNDLKKIRIAAIMDPFTFHSYNNECNVLELDPINWKQQAIDFAPHFVFIESAWQGKNELWNKKVSNNSIEVQELIAWSKSQKIPSIFWNKEDPVHYSTFIKVARQVDYIFTTDADCVPIYKHDCNTENVSLLPFAAQTQNHNPIEVHDRKNAFCFAGSYYLRYPERQRDMETLISTLDEIGDVEIYDRNFEKDHPHYKFPEHYEKYILGSLAFEDIDVAYKGYNYGINLNTIKDSQSMFARRMFELMASNTIVVSNFSRGMRLMFGDLTVSSDNKTEINRRLTPLVKDELKFRKHRLYALRKVLSEHTYKHRLAFLTKTVLKHNTETLTPNLSVIAFAKSSEEVESFISTFKNQTLRKKKLFLICSIEASKYDVPNVQFFTDIESLHQTLLKETGYTAFLYINDYYGANYLTDLISACQYSTAKAIGKSTFYQIKNSECSLINDGKQYQHVSSLNLRSSILENNIISTSLIRQYSENPEITVHNSKNDLLSIDEFNYCRDVNHENLSPCFETVNDLDFINSGLSLASLLSATDKLPYVKPDTEGSRSFQTILDPATLHESILHPTSKSVELNLEGESLVIRSRLSSNKHTYCYSKSYFTRDSLNLLTNSQYKIECENKKGDVKCVFEFSDINKQKISHSMALIGATEAMAIPNHCEFIRYGLRITGGASATIKGLVIGKERRKPSAIIAKNDTLVITKQYPSYDDLYKYGFLHTRVQAYLSSGKNVDIIRLKNDGEGNFQEFENIDRANADLNLLEATIATGQYKNILVHLMDQKMWQVIEKHIEDLNVTVWIHGAEIQHWKRREFTFNSLNETEIDHKKALSENRMKFWINLFKTCPKNLSFIFVSQHFANEVFEDLDIILPAEKYSIIHNFIDVEKFPYIEKPTHQRKKILSIRPYTSLYANDLSVKAIQLLSQRPFFNELEFRLVGNGELFEETVEPLREFKNVILDQRFLSHAEISELHKSYGIFLSPTRCDTQGVSRDEAMSSGLVPITNNVSAIPEFVDNNCGILADADDALGLADGIENLYHNPELFHRLSRRASDRVNSQSNHANTVRRELKALNK